MVGEGLYAVTRYQPQSDKIMRMHAQTAVIENGLVHLPKEAGWRAEYLFELSVPLDRPSARLAQASRPRAPRHLSVRQGAGAGAADRAPRAAVSDGRAAGSAPLVIQSSERETKPASGLPISVPSASRFSGSLSRCGEQGRRPALPL